MIYWIAICDIMFTRPGLRALFKDRVGLGGGDLYWAGLKWAGLNWTERAEALVWSKGVERIG